MLIIIALLLPLIGCIFQIIASSRISRGLSSQIACAAIFASFICFCKLFFDVTHPECPSEQVVLYNWLHVGQIHADCILRLDHLSCLMTLIITGVGFLIHLFSVGYMDHEVDFARYFSFLNFFVFMMLLLVLAGDLLLLFVGWEGVGLASYLLIGFWYERPAASSAAVKAFVINRIGDLGLLLGILLTYTLFSTSDISEVCALAQKKFASGDPLITTLTLLFFLGAVGKSAQLPLHTWLPDAMEGPTPVSALIHAATMVTAGVYLIVRLHPLYLLAPLTLNIIGAIGLATALFAALCAVGQTDLKRVLAYSTVSQLGYMFLACGSAAFYSAMFHLTTHAFVKALLFLSAGNVIHMMHGVTQMDKMGGLFRIFTKTHWLFLIGVLALSGVPPLAAFFSKDLILGQEYEAGYKVFYYTGLFTSFLTAIYLTRAYCLTFTGPLPANAHTATEAPKVMLIPVTLLALLTLGGGFLGFSETGTPCLEKFLFQLGIKPSEEHISTHFTLGYENALAIAASCFGVAAIIYVSIRNRQLLQRPLHFLTKSFYIDELYANTIVRPCRALSSAICKFFEPHFFDAGIALTSQGAFSIAAQFKRLQSGQIRAYVAWLVIGLASLILCLLW